MDTLRSEKNNSVAVFELCKGTTNALDMKVVDELSDSMDALAGDLNCAGLVLGSANSKFFSIGFDVPALYPLGPEDFEKFYKKFNKLCLDLYSLDLPTVAAIPGHATGGGCILVLCCDFRFMNAEKGTIGLPEIKLGVPVPYLADRILRKIMGDKEATKLMYSGEFITGREAHALGLIDELHQADKLKQKAIEKVETLATLSLDAFKAIKKNRTEEHRERISEFLSEKAALFLEMWFSDEARRLLKQILDKF